MMRGPEVIGEATMLDTVTGGPYRRTPAREDRELPVARSPTHLRELDGPAREAASGGQWLPGPAVKPGARPGWDLVGHSVHPAGRARDGFPRLFWLRPAVLPTCPGTG